MAKLRKPTIILNPEKHNLDETKEKPFSKEKKPNNDGFKEVKQKKGQFKNGSEMMTIRVLIKGKFYKVEAIFESGKIHDQEEYIADDIEYENNNQFKEKYINKFEDFCVRYLNLNNDEEDKYVLCKICPPEEFNYVYGGTCIIRTYSSSSKIRCTVTNEKAKVVHIEESELLEDVDKNKQCQKLFLATQEKYTVKKKFPENIQWLDKVLKKMPFNIYGKSKMGAFWAFVVAIIIGFILFLGLMGLLLEIKAKDKGAKKINAKAMKTSFFDQSKKWILSLEEPIWGIKDARCEERKDKRSCKPYCYHRIITEETCKETGFPWSEELENIPSVELELSEESPISSIPIKNKISKCSSIVLEKLPIGYTESGLFNIYNESNQINIAVVSSALKSLSSVSKEDSYLGYINCNINGTDVKYHLKLKVK